MIFSPIVAKAMNFYSRKNVLMFGLALEGVSMIVFGLMIFIEDRTTYVILCFIIRAVEGAGNACLSCSSSAIAASNFPD